MLTLGAMHMVHLAQKTIDNISALFGSFKCLHHAASSTIFHPRYLIQQLIMYVHKLAQQSGLPAIALAQFDEPLSPQLGV